MLCTDKDAQAVVKTYSNLVYKLAFSLLKNKADAEDVFQEVFIRLMKTDKVFENDEHLKAWLIKVTVNRSKKLLSSAWFRRSAPLEDYSLAQTVLTQDSEAFAGSEMENNFENSEVLTAVIELPLKYRTVIHLFYFEDMSVRSISRIFGVKESTITSQLSRGRKMLKEKLKGEYDYE